MRTVVVNPHASTGWLGRSLAALAAAALVGMASDLASAADADEFKVKRQNVFEFTAKPTVKHDGDKVTITFTSKAFCDATVAIEDGQGDGPSTGSGQGQPGIVRHLASGVLGPNAPAPFQKDSLSQTLVWDSKDDQGVYVRDASRCSVRVSLGLKPQFERTLFWSPHKRVSESSPLVKAATEGIYVVDGQVCDHVRLFDHQGRYVRTIYPFPADKVASVLGVTWHDFVQAGTKAPLKVGYHQGTLLTGGTNNNPRSHEEGRAAFAFAVRGDRIALTMLKLNRLATDGATGGRQLEGPPTSLPADMARYSGDRGNPLYLTPWSVEFSPDGKRLYLAGYAWTFWEVAKWDCLSGVFQMDYEGSDPPKLFAGTNKPYAFGAGDGDFHCATSVACDTAGRVYVSDYMNDRIQVLDASGKLLKSVPVNKPAVVRVHQKTGEMYVFSWPIHNVELSKNLPNSDRCYWSKVTPTLTRLGPLDDPRPLGSYPLPLPIYGNWWAKHPPGPMYGGEIDSWSEQTTIWISTVRGRATERGMGGGGRRLRRLRHVGQGRHKGVHHPGRQADAVHRFRQGGRHCRRAGGTADHRAATAVREPEDRQTLRRGGRLRRDEGVQPTRRDKPGVGQDPLGRSAAWGGGHGLRPGRAVVSADRHRGCPLRPDELAGDTVRLRRGAREPQLRHGGRSQPT